MIYLFKQYTMLPLNVSRCMVNAVYPAVFFFESHCLCFCLWCCISIPGRCSFQRSRTECCWHISMSFSIIITFVFDLFNFRPWFSLSSANSFSICCSSCGVLAHMSMSSANRRWRRYSQSLFKSLVSKVSRRNMLPTAAVNKLRDMVYPCRTLLLMLMFLLSLCRWIVIELLM